MRITPERLAEIEERERKATKGPWEVPSDGYRIFAGVGTSDLKQIGAVAWNQSGRTAQALANCEFMAKARADIPDLLADRKLLMRAIEKILANDEGLHSFEAHSEEQRSFQKGVRWAADILRAALDASPPNGKG